MKNTKILMTIVSVLIFQIPSFAKLEGTISKQHFYDLEKTIMTEVVPDLTASTEKYWDKNLFHLNKYRPIFMLSNKELYNLKPEKKASVVQRINSPSVYNISLRSATLTKVKLVDQSAKIQSMKKKSAIIVQKDIQAISLYEQAKSQGVEPEKKIDTAILLKDTNNIANYGRAIDLLDDVTRIEPYNAYAYQIKGDLYLNKNDIENAMKCYAEVLKLNPYSKQSYLAIAKILEPTNKELAQKYYDRAGLKNIEE